MFGSLGGFQDFAETAWVLFHHTPKRVIELGFRLEIKNITIISVNKYKTPTEKCSLPVFPVEISAEELSD